MEVQVEVQAQVEVEVQEVVMMLFRNNRSIRIRNNNNNNGAEINFLGIMTADTQCENIYYLFTFEQDGSGHEVRQRVIKALEKLFDLS